MTRWDDSASGFYLTGPAPCPYLKGRIERKLFTPLTGRDANARADALSKLGFRGSQAIAYRPACPACRACVSVRIVARDWRPSRSERRVLARNASLRATAFAAAASGEQFDLFSRYLAARHARGGMAGMDYADYAGMVEDSPVRTSIVEYRDAAAPGAPLVAACLTDLLDDGLSMVYSFFEPELSARSLGVYMILHHIAQARDSGRDYVYLGYWIEGSDAMAYKRRFAPMERRNPDGWRLMAKG